MRQEDEVYIFESFSYYFGDLIEMKNVDNKTNDNREIWNSFKGLLMALIVLGHSGIFAKSDLFGTLYSFTVSSFLFLPFLFNHDSFSKKNIKKIFRRYYIPFIFFVFLFILLKFLVYKDLPTLLDILKVLFFGTRHYLRETTASMILWFFPALISILILLMIYNDFNKKMKFTFFIVLLIIHYMMHIIDNYYLMRIPMGMAIAVYLFPLGNIVAFLYSNYTKYIQQYYIPIITTFLVLQIIYYGKRYNVGSMYFPESFYAIVLSDSIMITGFFTVLIIARIVNTYCLQLIGRKSIVIYTIHPLIIYTLSLIISSNNLFFSFIIYLFILGLSVIVALILDKLNVTKWIYPR